MAKLYPPLITTSIPAFYKRYNESTGEVSGAIIKVPYTMNQSVGYSQIDGFCLRLRNISSGTYVFAPQYSTTYSMDSNEVTFEINKNDAAKLEEGQFYRLQLSYYINVSSEVVIGDRPVIVDKTDPHAAKEIGYFSTVGLIKCVPYPTVTISGYSLDSTNLFTGSFLGVYDVTNAIDKTEKVSSYIFNIYDDKGALYYTTGNLIHNSANDSEYGQSTDSLLIDDFITSKEAIYKIEYIITTKNGLTVSSPLYRMTSEQLLAPNKKIDIITIPVPDEAYMKITFKGESVQNNNGEEDVYYGEYILTRASEEDGYTTWIEMHRFRLQDAKPSTVSFSDFSVKQGVKYKYGLSQYNIWNIVSTRLESKEVSIDYEDMFLFDGERQLKIRFNPKMTKFETTLLEQKTDTIGSKYPFITRNAVVEYKTFPISGLISYHMDNAKLFYKDDYDYIVNRKNTETDGVEKQEGLLSKYDLTEENILRERNFKLEVLDWLNNGKPKMFKSATEGNYIVRLMKVSLKPTDKLGRMLHTFSCTAYEVADFNYENLVKLGFVTKSQVSRYVSLWKTYNFADWKAGQDIVITFDSNISEFLIQDLLPGTKVKLYQSNISTPLEIIIGTTGSYRFVGSNQKIVKLVIPVGSKQRLSGTIECQYDGIRYSDFDSIKDIKLKTIISHQFIGVDPNITNIHFQSLSNQESSIKAALKSINQRILLNKDEAKQNGWLSQQLKVGSFRDYKDEFIPTDIIQSIKTDIFDFKKSKVKILNIEHAKFQLRDLIPIYKVPYQFLPEETKNIINEQYNNSHLIGDIQDLYNSSDSQIKFSTYRWSTTPFGQPYPIDKMTPVLSDNAVMNDPFCIFELFEYNSDIKTWQHFTGKRTVSAGNASESESYEGYYYDAYWAKEYMIKYDLLSKSKNTQLDRTAFVLTDNYDPTFFINDRIIYTPVLNETIDDEFNLAYYYSIIHNNKEQLYYKIIYNSWSPAVSREEILSEDAEDYYYILDSSGVQSTAVVSIKIPTKFIKDYLVNQQIYLNNLYVKDKNEKYIPLKDVENNNLYQQYEFYIAGFNKINLFETKEMEINNLGNVNAISIGNGIMVNLTMQLQIIDYLTEENDIATKNAKQEYLKAANFLKIIFEDYENIATADSEYCKYISLYNVYKKLVFGMKGFNIKQFTPVQMLIILALLNVEYVPRKVLYSFLCGMDEGESKVKIETLYNQNRLEYDFETVLKIIEPDQNRYNIVLKLYLSTQTLQTLSIMDEIEYNEILKALTMDDIESMAEKIHKLSAVLDEVTIAYNDLSQQQKNIINTFEDKKNKIFSRSNNYNTLLRRWFMALFLIETQLHRWGDENSLGPYTMSDIAAYYKNETEHLEQDIETGAQNETLWLAKAKNIYQEILQNLEVLYTYEKIKADREDDELLDKYITEKQYENIEQLFVKLYQLYLVKNEYSGSAIGQQINDIYTEQAYPAVMNFLISTEYFSQIKQTVNTIMGYSVGKCEKSYQNFMSYYPGKNSIADIQFNEVIEASKASLKEYAIYMDLFDYSSMYYLTELNSHLDNTTRTKINQNRTNIITNRTSHITRLLSVSESNSLNQERPNISFDTNDEYINPYSVVEEENLAYNVKKYFKAGVDWNVLYGSGDSAARKQHERIEEKARIDEMLKMINMISGMIRPNNTPTDIINIIDTTFLSEQGSSGASLRKIIYNGFAQDGLFKMVKEMNSSIEYYRLGWLNEMPANISYQNDLLNNEFIPALEAYNTEMANRNKDVVQIQQKYLTNYAKNAKYNLMDASLFGNNKLLQRVVEVPHGSNTLTTLESTSSERAISIKNISSDFITNQQIDNLYNGINNSSLLLQTKSIYADKVLKIYNNDQIIEFIIGHQFGTVKTGILYWYIRYNIIPNMEYFMQLMEQSTQLLSDYTNRQNNYATKYEQYEKLYKNAQQIYNSYQNTEQMEYYQKPSSSKEAKINQIVQNMQDAWDKFILALDKAYTIEVERGMYI